MVEDAIKKFQDYLKNTDPKNELFEDAKKISLQFVFHKIPNLINEKRFYCKLPNPLYSQEQQPEICLIVKDVNKKERDYDPSVRKYQRLVDKHNLGAVIKQIVPLKQLNLEFRTYESKRKLCTSFDLFLADKSLHEILLNGSKLGKVFRVNKKMPVFVDLDAEDDFKKNVDDIIESTQIRLTGKGCIVDINAFTSDHTVKQALENIETIKKSVFEKLPGGESNVKAIYLKSTNATSIPIYVDLTTNINEVKLPNNMKPMDLKRAKKFSKKLKRLRKEKVKKEKVKKEKKLKQKTEKKQTLID